ncbi:MAG: hypothetical protein K2X55_20115, partial [Burkholderiaceae bacterium]|nr:hypothetical protein [Burkholderiaceae bacterium]
MTAIRVILQSARLALFQPLGGSGVDLKGWLANQNYFIDTDIQKNQFSIRPSNSNEVAQALAHDLNRMSCAAFESAAGVGPDSVVPRSLAWGAIRSYYSAFFAAHAFMRLFGSGCVQLDADHVNKIFSSATLFQKTGTLTGLDAGFFHVEISPNFDSLKFVRLRDSHKDTWGTLIDVIEKINDSIPSATALSKHKVDASMLLADIKSGLSRSGSSKGNWLSTMRNSMNYQHSHGVWFPFSSRDARVELLDSASRSWLNTRRSQKPSATPICCKVLQCQETMSI